MNNKNASIRKKSCPARRERNHMSACLSEPAFLFTYLQPHYPHAHHIGQDHRHDDVWKSGCYKVVSDIRLCLGFVVPVWAGHAVRR